MILELTRPVQGAIRQEQQFETIANSLANVNSNGFKKDILSFDKMLNAKMTTDLSQGDMVKTGNDLDVAISGQGFFAVQTKNGIRYTRDGSFGLNENGQIINQDGNLVLSSSGTITVPEGTSHITISEKGEINANGEVLGSLRVSFFQEPEKLKKEGSSLFVYNGNLGGVTTSDNFQVKQGVLEKSNVSGVVEMTKMIKSNRMYDAFNKIILSFDETNTKAITEVGRP